MINAGLILEGGAARGVFTAGVLDYLMKKDLYFSYVVGVSAGSCNGIDYVSRQIGRSRDCMIPKEKKDAYVGKDILLKKHKLWDMDKIFGEYPYKQFPFDFAVYQKSEIQAEWVVTNCKTGRAEYMDNRESMEALLAISRASSSIPVLTPMVDLGGQLYVDGGVADSIPLEHTLSKGYEKNVLILTRNPGYQKDAPGNLTRLLYERTLKEYPKLRMALETRNLVYNRTIRQVEKLEREGKLFVIRPMEKTVGRAESHQEKLIAFYQHGYDSMKEQMDALRTYLQK
ncbi:MAG: patatin family protein [Lachnospiraceae bacterium]|nr:patatin family protein [Lachnospiraceae bacterium]